MQCFKNFRGLFHFIKNENEKERHLIKRYFNTEFNSSLDYFLSLHRLHVKYFRAIPQYVLAARENFQSYVALQSLKRRFL